MSVDKWSKMNKKAAIGLTLILCIAFASFIVLALGDVDGEDPPVLQGDSPGAHQCPRDNYDDNTGPTERNGFGDDF
jgi:hypothetical protein